MKKSFSFAAAIVLLSLAVVQASVSVPNLVNFQGRLTDAAGTPVADGAYGVTFRLFTASSGGSLVWAETSLVTTNNGVFTHNLGEDNPFDVTLFQDYDSLFLEIVVGGETMTPRSRLTSAPYTRLAGGIEMPSGSTSPETLGIATLPNIHNFIVFGSDGKRNVEIGGAGFGEVWLRDGTAGNNLIADLTATTNSGGRLILNKSGGSAGVDINAGVSGGGSTLNMRNDIGSVTVSFDADGSGNTAAVVPVGSISSIEMTDEPGIAAKEAPDFFSLVNSTATQKVDSVIITTPAAGKVLVQATGYANLSHTNGTQDNIAFNVHNTELAELFVNGVSSFTIPSSEATGSYRYPFACQMLFNAPSATTLKIYLLVRQYTGANIALTDVAYSYISAVYYPTAYGNTPVLVSSSSVTRDGNAPAEATASQEVTYQTAEEFEQSKLEFYQTEMAALKARLEKLEQQNDQNRQTAGAGQ